MKIKVTTVEEIEVDIQFPHYRKSSAHHYKVFKLDRLVRCIQIYQGFYVHECGIKDYPAEYAFANDIKECTREEFESAYKQVSDKLNELALDSPILIK